MRPIALTHQFVVEDDHEGKLATADVQRRHGHLFVFNLWVCDGLRRSGYGRALITQIIAVFGAEPIYLHAVPYAGSPLGDQELMNWYAALGFIPVAAFPGGMVRPATPNKE